ncbi:MAG: hypothetical protein H7X80_06030 [bacterium]|nr:hypothetical protein [Candidatus Kapabacteria bacterium]
MMRLSLSLIVCVVCAASVRLDANVTDPVQPGIVVGEPFSSLRGLVVERERLDIDLRALEMEIPDDGEEPPGYGTVLVSASYTLRNDSSEQTMVLEYVAELADTAQWSVYVDGRRIASTFSASVPLPSEYALPATTPGIDGGPIEVAARAPGTIRFEAPLSSGHHSMRVEYIAHATRRVIDHPLVHWQLAYIFAPRHSGSLDISITLPPRWGASSVPSLERNNDVLRGHFKTVPIEALALTMRARYRWWHAYLAWIPSALVTLVGGFAALRSGRRLGRRLARAGKGLVRAFPASIGAGFVLASATLATGFLGAEIADALIGDGQQAWGSFDFKFYQIAFTSIALITGTACAQFGAAYSMRRARRRYDSRWADAYGEPSAN